MTLSLDCRPTGLALWMLAARPRTLTISVVPVAVGLALAWAEAGAFHALLAAAAMLGALLIQIGTNLHNDAADGERGVDDAGRVGPPRVTAEGWAAPGQVRAAAFLCFGLAAVAGVYIAWAGGWPILLLGVVSLVAGWCYSGGPLPISYTPLGELFVWLFFGLAAVCGTYGLQAGAVSHAAALGGTVVGLPAAAVLLVNNHRDRDTDARAGRRTFAILCGVPATVAVYAALMLAPFPTLLLLDRALSDANAWLAWGSLPTALTLIRAFAVAEPGPGLNALLGRTARFQAVMGALLVVGLLW